MPTLTSRLLGRRSKPTVALGGAGYIAVVHALAAQASEMRVVAVASLGGSSARHLAGQLDARRTSIDALPGGADIFIVASPPDSHLSLALQGVRAGAVVLVEKPLTTTLAQADELLGAVDAGAVIRCGENLFHAPVIVKALELMPSFSSPDHLSIRTMQPSPDWGHFAKPLTFGGALFDLGPHAVALAMRFANEAVVSVTATLNSSRPDGADDDARVKLEFESGLVATLEVSWTTPHTVWDAQISSESGVIRIELLPEVLLEHNGDPVPVEAHHPGVEPALESYGYLDQIIDLKRLAQGTDSGTSQSVQDARDVLEVICAAYASAGRSGRAISLPFAGDRNRSPLELWRGETGGR